MSTQDQWFRAIPDEVKSIVDFGGIGVLIASLIHALPHITALLTLIWVCIRIYETQTARGIIASARAWIRSKEAQDE